MTRGFTLLEILITIGIIILLAGIGTYVFVNAKNSKELDLTTQTLVFKLNEARSNAIAGKNGQNFGVKFNTSSYVYFSGSSYNASDPANISYSIPSGIGLTYTFPGPDNAVIFSRMTGAPQTNGTTTLTRTNNASITQAIVIGIQGDISVVK